MRAERNQGCFFIRLNRGEEVVSSLEKFAAEKGIETGDVRAIGAITDFELGYYIIPEKKYIRKKFEVNAELISGLGNFAIKEGKNFLHMHISAGLPDFSVVGGHFFSGIVSATVEAFITPFEKRVERQYDEETGLFLLDLPAEAF